MVNIHEIHAMIKLLTNDLITKSCGKCIVTDYLASFDSSHLISSKLILQSLPSFPWSFPFCSSYWVIPKKLFLAIFFLFSLHPYWAMPSTSALLILFVADSHTFTLPPPPDIFPQFWAWI